MTGFKIRFKRVKRVLSQLDTSKSANGVGNLFLRECAVELAPAMTKYTLLGVANFLLSGG